MIHLFLLYISALPPINEMAQESKLTFIHHIQDNFIQEEVVSKSSELQILIMKYCVLLIIMKTSASYSR